MKRVVIGLVTVTCLLAACADSGGDDSDPIIVFGPWVGTEADAMAEVLSLIHI